MPSTWTVTAAAGLGLSATPARVVLRNVAASTLVNVSGAAPFRSIPSQIAVGIGYIDPVRVTATAIVHLVGVSAEIRTTFYTVAAHASLGLAPSASELAERTYAVSAHAALNLLGAPEPFSAHIYTAEAQAAVKLSPAAVQSVPHTYEIAASAGLHLSSVSPSLSDHIYALAAVSHLALSGAVAKTGIYGVRATAALSLSGASGAGAAWVVSATTSLHVVAAAAQNRDIHVSASVSLGLAGVDSEGSKFFADASVATVTLTASAAGVLGPGPRSGISFLSLRGLASASIVLANGGGVPGGDTNSGLTQTLALVSGNYPLSFAETPTGLLLAANGIDPPIRWDGMAGTALTAGVSAPSTAPVLSGSGAGTLVGTRYGFVRFLDAAGNLSNLGPLSAPVFLGRDGLIDGITFSASGVVTIWSVGHRLPVGAGLTIAGVQGLATLNTTCTVASVPDADHFTLAGIAVASGAWTQGGSWTWGSAAVVYTSVPVPSDSKVIRRQILRNLDGDADVFYVDQDTADLTSTSFTSSRTDESLAQQLAVPLVDGDEFPLANRFGVPPDWKSVLLSHYGRVFAAVDQPYSEGCCVPTAGSVTVQGIGTGWLPNWAGRFLYVVGSGRPYEIQSVNPSTQQLTLTTPYLDPTQQFALYTIRPAVAERKLVYYSEAGLPEAWPPWNAFAVPEDGDDLTGLLELGTFLFVVESRRLYRFTYDDDPAAGHLFHAADRGSINNRCVVRVENNAYMLDESGIHVFDGDSATPLSEPIQALFQQDATSAPLLIDWTADSTLWSGTADPVRNTVRWFVQMAGFNGIFHAICYNYRAQRWWIEQYPTQITASGMGVVPYRRAIAGTEARRVLALSEGTLDGVASVGTLRGAVTSANTLTITDSTAAFAANLQGAPVAIAEGTGKGQTGIISSNTATTLTTVDPWETVPDGTSVYQIGGVSWTWQSGWLEFADDQQDNPRDFAVVYQPTVAPATMDLSLFFDHSTSPRVWYYSLSQDGTTAVSGQSDVTFALQQRQARSGYSEYRMTGHADPHGYGDLYVSVLLAGVQGIEAIRVYQITVKGVVDPGESE